MGNKMEQIKELLSKVGLFADLGPEEKSIVASFCEITNVKKGEDFFASKLDKEEFFFVKSGEMLITKEVEPGKRIDLALYRHGDSFGEFNLFEQSTADIQAEALEDMELVIFPQRSIELRQVMENHPGIFAKILYKLLRVTSNRIRETNKLLTDKADWMESLKKQIYSDKLTGAFNQSFLDEEVASSLPRLGEFTSFLVIKPDNFKSINDDFGHEVGDKTLRLLSDTYKTTLRSQDMLVRYRSNEFVRILPDTEPEQAKKIAEDLLHIIRTLNADYIQPGLTVPASIGISTYPLDGNNIKDVVNMGYERLWYGQKQGGWKVTPQDVEFNTKKS